MSIMTGNAPRHPGLWTDTSIAGNQPWQHTGISSLASHSQGRQELLRLCPQLAQLSQQGRWIVLINAPANIGYKETLARAGVRMDRVLLVRTKDEIEALWATERALTNGTSSAVISWINSLDARDNRRLQLVARNARAMGVVLETGRQAKEIDNRLNELTRSIH